MKNVLQIVTLLTFGLLITNCSSNGDKANKLIRERMSKTLVDYSSYDPIETTITEAKATAFNDSICWKLLGVLSVTMKTANMYAEEAKEEEAFIEAIESSSFNPPSFYEAYENAITQYKSAIEDGKPFAKKIKDRISTLDETSVIGWEVYHKFRSKNEFGNLKIYNFRFVLDKRLQKIMIEEDLDDEFNICKRQALDSLLLSDTWD